MSKVHEVVELLVKRVESNPEEFSTRFSRWQNAIADIAEYGTDEDRKALDDALYELRMREVHGRVLKQLLNGDALNEQVLAGAVHATRNAAQQVSAQQLQNAYAQLQNQTGSQVSSSLLGSLQSKYPK
jgi:hypothetical protein